MVRLDLTCSVFGFPLSRVHNGNQPRILPELKVDAEEKGIEYLSSKSMLLFVQLSRTMQWKNKTWDISLKLPKPLPAQHTKDVVCVKCWIHFWLYLQLLNFRRSKALFLLCTTAVSNADLEWCVYVSNLYTYNINEILCSSPEDGILSTCSLCSNK